MQFQPKSAKEIQEMGLFPAGDYPFTVIEADECKSKSGNEMIKLKLEVIDINNQDRVVYDYLLEQIAYKLRHFAEATGLLDKYDSGTLLAQHCIGKSGYLKLIIQKDQTGQYADKNAVKDYITVEKAKSIHPDMASGNMPFNDDLPF